jgi:aminopeptidase N
MGLSGKTEGYVNEVALAHEVAHQWWGNSVGWQTYHDQWLSEGFASYASVLHLAREKDDRRFRALMQSYKQDLLGKTEKGDTIESGGPIWLGRRLSNSLNPDGYANIVYKKACWVIHMLRVLMTDTTTGSDERFFRMLRDFLAAYRDQYPSTQDFIRYAEKYMTRDMDLEKNRRLDWFFADWVYGTGIPTYKLEVQTRRLAPQKFVVEGTIEQSGVPPEFEMLVPLAAIYSKDRKTTLGRVTVGEGGGSFRFTTTRKPARVAIDEHSILAVVR